MRQAAALGATLAVFALTGALAAWMIAKVAEHPGVSRELGALPPWFAADSRAPGQAQSSPAAPAAASSAAAGAAADAGFVEVAGSTIEIALLEYQMRPAKIRVQPGAVTFVLRNEGRYAHDFHVEGPGIDAYAAKFSPGRSARLELSLKEGQFKISCPLSNHDERGMSGTLVVAARPAGS